MGVFIIRVTTTEWVFLITIVPKKNKHWKVCINYKVLNKVMKKDRFPLPFIDELLDTIA